MDNYIYSLFLYLIQEMIHRLVHEDCKITVWSLYNNVLQEVNFTLDYTPKFIRTPVVYEKVGQPRKNSAR